MDFEFFEYVQGEDQEIALQIWAQCFGLNPDPSVLFVEFMLKVSALLPFRSSLMLTALNFFHDNVLCGDDIHRFAIDEGGVKADEILCGYITIAHQFQTLILTKSG